MEARVPSQQVESSADSPREAQSDTMKPALLKQLLEDINREYKQRNISLRFSIHEATNSLVVRVLDIDTEKVIRQLPPDEILVLRTRMQEMLGEIFDAQA
jgi:flagellar protein FlaG